MQALLYAIGLGAGAIPMAAALNWVIKDGLGQLGGRPPWGVCARAKDGRADADVGAALLDLHRPRPSSSRGLGIRRSLWRCACTEEHTAWM